MMKKLADRMERAVTRTSCSPTVILLVLLVAVLLIGAHYKNLVLHAIMMTTIVMGMLIATAGLAVFVASMVRIKRGTFSQTQPSLRETLSDAPASVPAMTALPPTARETQDAVPDAELADLNQPGLGVTADGKITV